MASLTEALRSWLLAPVLGAISEMRGTIMANITAVLGEVRDGINGPLREKVVALLARNAELEAQAAGQEAEEAEEGQAAAELRDAFNGVAGLFEPTDVPVDPVDPIDPGEGGDEGGDEGTV